MRDRVAFVVGMTLLLSVAQPTATRATPPSIVSYQGVLTDAAGVAVENGEHDLLFEIFPSAAGGSAIWFQSIQAAVTDGLYNVLLSKAGLSIAFENGETYMQVTITAGPGIGGDVVLSPRQRIASVPYALAAPQEEVPTARHAAASIPKATISLNATEWTDLGASASVTTPLSGSYAIQTAMHLALRHSIAGDREVHIRIVEDSGAGALPVRGGATTIASEEAATLSLHHVQLLASAGATYTYRVEARTCCSGPEDYSIGVPDPDGPPPVDEAGFLSVTAVPTQ